MATKASKSMTPIPPDLRRIPGRGIARLGTGTTQIDVGWTQCRAFLGHRIVSCGVTRAQPGFAFARPAGAMGVIMATVSGSGWVRIGERWRRWGPGMAVLMPAAAAHAYCHAGPGTWHLAWVCYREAEMPTPAVPGMDCMLAPLDAEALAAVITACQRERLGASDPAVYHHYAELIDTLARRAIGGAHDARLDPVWEAVAADLARPWTLGDLARLAGMSIESLRVACQRVTARSPVEHVTRLRMEQAAGILALGGGSVASVATDVGYENPFAFSTAFKRAWGVSPATYRGKRRGGFVMPDA